MKKRTMTTVDNTVKISKHVDIWTVRRSIKDNAAVDVDDDVDEWLLLLYGADTVWATVWADVDVDNDADDRTLRRGAAVAAIVIVIMFKVRFQGQEIITPLTLTAQPKFQSYYTGYSTNAWMNDNNCSTCSKKTYKIQIYGNNRSTSRSRSSCVYKTQVEQAMQGEERNTMNGQSTVHSQHTLHSSTLQYLIDRQAEAKLLDRS